MAPVLVFLDLACTAAATLALLPVFAPGPGWIRHPVRLALLALVLFITRAALTRPRAQLIPAASRVALLTLATSSVAVALTHLSTICGGADSYGYVSAARLIGHGALSQPQPDAAWLPVGNPLTVLAPLGYVPHPSTTAIVPVYPLGFPALIAAANLVLPFDLTPYLVAPAMTVVLLALVHAITRQWTGDALPAWLATALVAWDPLVVAYAKQPMSDVPAAAWLMLAVWALGRGTPLPFVAGLAAGASFLTRPGGLGAVAAIAGLAMLRGQPRRLRTLAWFAAGVAPMVALQALLQWRLFGSPWQTGYGSLGSLYAGSEIVSNLGIYVRALVSTHSVPWLPLVLVGLFAVGGTRAAWILTLLAASLTPYLLYFRFDHWETLRFIMPAVVVLDIAAAIGAVWIASKVRSASAALVAALLVAAIATTQAWIFLRAEGVPLLTEQERRYALTADWIDSYTPRESLVLAGQHSGSIRHYASRTTLRWDLMAPGDLEPTVREAARRAVPLYTALDRAEQPAFRSRFSGSLEPPSAGTAPVVLLPGAQVGDVQIWELVAR